MEKVERVIYFDGICALCNHFVDFLVVRKNSDRFRFTPLQGQYAQAHLPTELNELKTVAYQRAEKLYLRSSAALWILYDLGGLWSALIIFLIVPAFIRDWFYNLIAKNRYKWFGIKESCRLPSPEEAHLFLD